MSLLPKIKSAISSFLVGEEGKISKQSILSLGAIFAGSAAGLAGMAKAATTCYVEFTPPQTEIGKCVHSSTGCTGCGCGGSCGCEGGCSGCNGCGNGGGACGGGGGGAGCFGGSCGGGQGACNGCGTNSCGVCNCGMCM